MRIAVSSWSLNKKFVNEGMTMPEFVKYAKNEFGVEAIEAVNWMVCPLTDEQRVSLRRAFRLFMAPSYNPEEMAKSTKAFKQTMLELGINKPDGLDELKDALEKYGVRLCNMPIDYGNISQLDETARKEDLQIIKNWIDVASYLGSKGVRVNTGNQPEGTFDLSITAKSYKELAEYAQDKGIYLILENHHGMSADPDNIVKLFEMVNHPNFRICPDFGNFAPEIRYEALEKIFNNPVLVHAKTYEFDENGEHTTFDFAKCMTLAKKHGYTGYYSVEFEGPGDQVDGVKKTIELLNKYM